jgi:alpha-glucosidase
VVLPDAHASAVAVNGNAIARLETRAAWDASDTGWYQGDDNLVLVKAGRMPIDVAKAFTIDFAERPATTSIAFVCDNGGTVPGENVYVTGNTDRLGNWAPGSALKLTPSAYPKWTGVLMGLPPNADIAWKCFVMADGAASPSRFTQGDNVVVHTPASGFGGTSYARF